MEDWLESIGLGAHAAAFRAHGVTRDLLERLNDGDLRELGLSLGERKRFTVSLSDLDMTAAVGQAERRPLTMMFVDIVGSSRLSEILLPEDMMELVRRYRDFCAVPILRYGGSVGRMVGDGILAHFCYPVANENDPERAVRAALDIVRGVGGLTVPGDRPLAVRVGIATGSVIVGDLEAAGSVERRAIIGAAPNVAARLQGLAPPGGAVIAEETYRRVRDRFVCADLGSYELRGMSLPHQAWQVLREAEATGRAARQPNEPTPLCGRVAELTSLRERWDDIVRGAGACVVLTGEAGIGKSRVVEAFLNGTRSGSDLVALEGSPFEMNSPLRPVIDWLQSVAGSPSDSEQVRLTRLRDALPGWDKSETVLSGLVGFAAKSTDGVTPEQLREATLQAIIALILRQAAVRPLRLVAEDLHWFDPTTLELMGRLAAAVADNPVMMLLTTRDDFSFQPALGWPALPANASVLRLDRLGADEMAEMAASMLPGTDVSPALLATITRKAGGVPLFFEEVVRSLTARGYFESGGELAESAIPASLQEALAGRLDRTGAAKEVAQIASVIGRDVRRDVLAEVCRAHGISEAALELRLDTLIRAAILRPDDPGILRREQPAPPGAPMLGFTHALLTDTAYNSLLRDNRRALHMQVAHALQRCDPDSIGQQPEVLALHLSNGHDPLAAAPHWLEAARRSLSRSALAEATDMLRRGMSEMDGLAADPVVLERRLQFVTLLGPATIALHGPGSTEASQLYASGYALCQQMPEDASHFPIYWGWWRVSRDFRTLKRRSAALLERAAERDDPEFLLQAHHCAWATTYDAGEFARSAEHCEAGLIAYERGDYRHHAQIFGNHDPKACAHCELALIRFMQGRPVSALAQGEAALAWSTGMDHLGTLVHVMDLSLVHRVKRREHRIVYEHANEFIAFTTERGLKDHRAKGEIFKGWSIAMRDNPERGVRMLNDGIVQQRESGTNEDAPIYACLLAEALIAARQPDRALDVLTNEFKNFTSLGTRVWLPEVLRTMADATLAGDASAIDPANGLLLQAESIARSQKVPLLRLRAALARHRLSYALGTAEESELNLTRAIAEIPEPETVPEIAVAVATLRERSPVPMGVAAFL